MAAKSYSQRIKAAEARGSHDTADRMRQERDLAYINEVHGFAQEIIRALDKRRYADAAKAMRAASGQLLARAEGLERCESDVDV